MDKPCFVCYNKNMNKVVLKVENLSKQYKERFAVEALNFSLYEGEIVGFIGSNGAGKSTTIKLITGLIKPTTGNIEICGENISNREKALAHLGAIVETPHFYEYLTAQQNLEYFASYFDNVSKAQIENILKLVKLYDRKDDKVCKYSLGMKQRLGIAQSLLNNPKILILDEPTNGLDAEGIVRMRKFLKYLVEKTKVSILISSHILSELQNLCDRFIIIDNGRIKEEFKNQSLSVYNSSSINTFINVDNPKKAVMVLKDILKKEIKQKDNKIYFHSEKEERVKIFTLLTKNGVEVYAIGNVKLALEQKFLNTIKQK